MNELEIAKDKVAIEELKTVITRLKFLLEIAQDNIGKCRPIIYHGEIDLIKDHLDLVVKYSKLY